MFWISTTYLFNFRKLIFQLTNEKIKILDAYTTLCCRKFDFKLSQASNASVLILEDSKSFFAV